MRILIFLFLFLLTILFCLDRCFSIFSLKKDQLIEPHPKFQINESKLIENSTSQIEKSIQKSDKLLSKINLKPPKFSFEIDSTHKKSSDKGEVGFFSINIISFNMKVLYTRSILSGILQSINEKCTIAEESDSYKEIKSFWIKDHDKSLFELKITAYAPRIFKKLILKKVIWFKLDRF